MNESIDPAGLGLPSQKVIRPFGKDHLTIVINRKSRLVMADAKKLLVKAAAIRKARPGVTASLLTNAPVCAKSFQFLRANSIETEVNPDV